MQFISIIRLIVQNRHRLAGVLYNAITSEVRNQIHDYKIGRAYTRFNKARGEHQRAALFAYWRALDAKHGISTAYRIQTVKADIKATSDKFAKRAMRRYLNHLKGL